MPKQAHTRDPTLDSPASTHRQQASSLFAQSGWAIQGAYSQPSIIQVDNRYRVFSKQSYAGTIFYVGCEEEKTGQRGAEDEDGGREARDGGRKRKEKGSGQGRLSSRGHANVSLFTSDVQYYQPKLSPFSRAQRWDHIKLCRAY